MLRDVTLGGYVMLVRVVYIVLGQSYMDNVMSSLEIFFNTALHITEILTACGIIGY